MKRNSWRLLLAVVTSVAGCFIFAAHASAAVYYAPSPNHNLSTNTILGEPTSMHDIDLACYNRMESDGAYSSTATRAEVNNARLYAPYQWISTLNDPLNQSYTESPSNPLGQVYLQFNSLEFVCNGLVADHSVVGGGTSTDPIKWPATVENPSYPSNLSGLVTNTSSIYYPAMDGQYNYIYNATSSLTGTNGTTYSGGSLSNDFSNYLDKNEEAGNSNSRYWFDSPLTFNYTPPKGSSAPPAGTYTLKISLNEGIVNRYYGQNFYCNQGKSGVTQIYQSSTSDPPFSTVNNDCLHNTETLYMTIVIPNTVTVTGRIVNQYNLQGVQGVQIDAGANDVNTQENYTTTNSGGYFSFTFAEGAAFHLDPQGTNYTLNGNQYYLQSSQFHNRPIGFNYGDPYSRCKNYAGIASYQGYCTPVAGTGESNTSYQCQIANKKIQLEACPSPLYIYSGGGQGMSYDFVIDQAPSPVPAVSCPTGQSTTQGISLPSKMLVSGYFVSTSPPPAATPIANNGYAYAKDVFKVANAFDTKYGTPIYSTQGTAFETTNNFTLNYRNYITSYPYDDHSTTVDYQQQYDLYRSSSSPDYYVGSTAYYNYHLVTLNQPENGTYTNTPEMEDCDYRNFTVEQPRATDISGITFNGAATKPASFNVSSVIGVKYTLPAAPQKIENPNFIQSLTYTPHYYVYPASATQGVYAVDTGAWTPQSVKVSSNGTANVNINNLALPLPLSPGDQVCADFIVTPGVGSIDGEVEAGKTSNIVSGSGSVSSSIIKSPTNSNTWTCSTPVSSKPYTRSYGNDAQAGIQFQGSQLGCQTANINVGSGPGGPEATGSGSQFASFASGTSNDFWTAFDRPATNPPNSSYGLSFANSPGPGSFTANCPTVPNYFLQSNTVSTPPFNYKINTSYDVTNSNSPVLINMAPRTYLTLTGNMANNSQSHIVYVNGNVYIPNDITFSRGNFSYSGNTAGIKIDSPSLEVIVHGNIYIASTVKHLDGIYVAESDCDVIGGANCSSTTFNPVDGGVINTCATTPGSGSADGSYTSSQAFSACNNQLVIGGELIGDEVKLNRTFSSDQFSTPGENPWTGTIKPCNTPTTVSVLECSAEQFNFNPENFIGNMTQSNGSNGSFNSIVSLPPVF